MKTKLNVVTVLLSFSTLVSQLSTAFAQNTVVTYQGRVTSGATNFNGAGQFKFALVTVTNTAVTATATANPPSGGFVTIINVTLGGSGYVIPPAVTISGGGGSGATATASISGGAVTSITVNSTGSSYASTPTVTIAAPPENISYTTYWSNDGTSSAGSEPAASVSAPVSGGLFTARLGDAAIANMSSLPAGLFTQPDLQLRLWFNDGLSGFALLNPAQRLTATPYALMATGASNLLGTVSTANLGGTYGNAVTFNNAGNSFIGSHSGNGGGLTNVNATTLGGLSSANFWRTNGNAGANPASGAFLGTTDTNALEFKVNSQRAQRIEYATNVSHGYSPNLVGGYSGNVVSNGFVGAVIGGGGSLNSPNRVGSHLATVVGGLGNTASGFASTAMGYFAMASGLASTAMGFITTASGDYSTAMGVSTTASGDFSAAMGRHAKANHQGAFVWADSTDLDFASTVINQFRVRAGGGMEIVGGTNQPALRFSGARTGDFGTPVGFAENTNPSGPSAPALRVVNNGGDSVYGALSVSAAGTGFIATFGNSSAFVSRLSTNGTWTALAFTPTSDRNAKENFTPVNARDVLDKVAAMPVARWNYKAAPGLAHIGPVAQDFHAAFGLNGDDDKHIATVDADGVALAAIQGLLQLVNEQETEIRALKTKAAEVDKLNHRFAELETRIQQLNTR